MKKILVRKYKIIIIGLICSILFLIIELLSFYNHKFLHEDHEIIIRIIAFGTFFILSAVFQYYNIQQIKHVNKLEKLNELKSEFLRRASHELKTPLISIKGFSNLLLTLHQEDLNKEINSMLIEIDHGCQRLEDIIKTLIVGSTLESSELKPQMSLEDLSFLIKFCSHEFSPLIKSKSHTLTVKIEDKIMTRFNKEQMYEVISNLLSNAIKYTPPNGKINIQTELKNNNVIFKIHDTGIGFTENEKTQVFKQFGKIERFGQGFDIEIDGIGLGLYISKKIIELHGGKIWFESAGRNVGSTFSFSLPIKTF